MAGVIEAQFAHRLKFSAYDPELGILGALFPITFIVDASIREGHDMKIATTKHPVYQGIPVTDNARPEPDTLSVVCLFSNTAVRIDDAFIKLAGDGPAEIREQMKEIAKKGWLWTVDTYFEVYENMLMSSMSVPHTVKNGKTIEMTLNFSQVRKATVSSFENSVGKPRLKENGITKVLGAKANEAAAEALKKSAAAAVVDMLTGG